MQPRGISFVVRVRNEEATLERSLASLRGLTVPHEIVVVLHRCTDGSAEIVDRALQRNKHVRVLQYEERIARAGYETLATDADSYHSLVRYTNWCFAQTCFPWSFCWDADMVMTAGLLAFLNGENWLPARRAYRFNVRDSTSNNHKRCLVCGLLGFGKFYFWETPLYGPGTETVERTDLIIEHASELTELKSYWQEEPWYNSEDTPEAQQVRDRILALTAQFGPEPSGAARALNPECDRYFFSIRAERPSYVNYDA